MRNIALMDIKRRILDLEQAASLAGISHAEMLSQIGIHRATWDRWKAGTTSPRLSAWVSINDMLSRLLRKRAA